MKILLLDVSLATRVALRESFDDAGVTSLPVQTVADARKCLDGEGVDLLLIGASLPGDCPSDRRGIQAVAHLRREGVRIPIVVIGTHGGGAEGEEALRAGAQDHIEHDAVGPGRLRDLIERFRPDDPLGRMASDVGARRGVDALLGSSAPMAALRARIRRAAPSAATVLILGETGTGKELVARALHEESPRHAEPFVSVNCAALPPALIESMLFGHARGAFTGAERRHRGPFEVAGSGTVLLDEIGDMSLDVQAKLLRVLEERQVQPLGSNSVLDVRARVVAATNANLERRVAAGDFRSDLFYRLNVIRIDVPALIERRDDIPELVGHFVSRAGSQIGLTEDAFAWFVRQPWPGNVRELRNAVERLVALHAGDTLNLAAIKMLGRSYPANEDPIVRGLAAQLLSLAGGTGTSKLNVVERILVAHAMEVAAGNKSEAARLLNIPRTSLVRKLERIDRGRQRRGERTPDEQP